LIKGKFKGSRARGRIKQTGITSCDTELKWKAKLKK